ncbi:MAG: hypothetical protein WBC78_08190 [Candidatus Sulfotelmatobacter sp.]
MRAELEPEFGPAEIGPAELEPAPHPAMKAHAINNAAVTSAVLTSNNASIIFLTGIWGSEMIQRHYQETAYCAGNQRSLAQVPDFRKIWDHFRESCRP